jgi:hypothetical protein
MTLRDHLITFVAIVVVILLIGLIAGGGLSSSAIIGALGVGLGGTAGVAYRNQRRASA